MAWRLGRSRLLLAWRRLGLALSRLGLASSWLGLARRLGLGSLLGLGLGSRLGLARRLGLGPRMGLDLALGCLRHAASHLWHVHCAAIGSIRLGSLFLTLLTREHVISSDG